MARERDVILRKKLLLMEYKPEFLNEEQAYKSKEIPLAYVKPESFADLLKVIS